MNFITIIFHPEQHFFSPSACVCFFEAENPPLLLIFSRFVSSALCMYCCCENYIYYHLNSSYCLSIRMEEKKNTKNFPLFINIYSVLDLIYARKLSYSLILQLFGGFPGEFYSAVSGCFVWMTFVACSVWYLCNLL